MYVDIKGYTNEFFGILLPSWNDKIIQNQNTHGIHLTIDFHQLLQPLFQERKALGRLGLENIFNNPFTRIGTTFVFHLPGQAQRASESLETADRKRPPLMQKSNCWSVGRDKNRLTSMPFKPHYDINKMSVGILFGKSGKTPMDP